MERPYRYIIVERLDAVFCVRLKQLSLTDLELEDLGAEIARLVDEENCRKLVLVLGPEEPTCLYSVFLAKLVNLQKRLANDGGTLVLAQLSETGRAIFEAAGLERYFRVFADPATACAAVK
jgi:STAS domain-containing protein